MNTQTIENSEISLNAEELPRLLLAELDDAIADASWFGDRVERADDVRYCRWDGQSADGRKHAKALGREPFPWDGASDCRIRTADEIVNDEVRMMISALRRATFQSVGIGTEDIERNTRVTQLLHWQIQTSMRDQMRRELELAAQWRQAYGSSATCVQWGQETRRVAVELTRDDAAAMLAAPAFQQLGEQATEADAAGLIQAAQQALDDPLQEDVAIAGIKQGFPLATKAELRSALATVRLGEVAELDQEEVFDGGPRIFALRIFTDIFFPPNTWDIQRARWVAHRELLTETELRDRIGSMGYDAEWVEKAIEQKGKSKNAMPSGWFAGQSASWWRNIEDTDELIEVYHFFHRTTTRKNLVRVMHTVLHPGVPDITAWSGELDYDHGKYPYVIHQREHLSRTILDSRGIPELADTWQSEIKAQRDSRVDRTSLTTLPPVLVPPTRGAMRLTFGPGVQWPKRRGEEIEWMKVPPFDGASIEIEKATERNIDRYFGRMSENNPSDRAILYQQHLVDGWLGELEQIAGMILQLDQQYLPDEIAIRVASAPIRMNRQEIQGQYDTQIIFDVRNMNAEMLKEKLELINTMVLPLDRFGAVDLAKMVRLTLGAVDPVVAELVLQDVGAASKQQEEEELSILADMVAGIERPMEPMPGTNYALRLQILQGAIGKNPEIQQMIASRPILGQMVEARMKFLAFQTQQIENATTGKVGSKPVLPE